MLYLCGPPRSKDNPPEQGTVNWLELTLSGNYTRLVLSKRPGQSILPMIHSLTSQQKVLAKIMLDFIDGNIWGGGGVTWSNCFYMRNVKHLGQLRQNDMYFWCWLLGEVKVTDCRRPPSPACVDRGHVQDFPSASTGPSYLSLDSQEMWLISYRILQSRKLVPIFSTFFPHLSYVFMTLELILCFLLI